MGGAANPNRGPTFDLHVQADFMRSSVAGNPVLVAAFVLLIPLAIGVAAGRMGLGLGLHGLPDLALFGIASVGSAPFGYLVYRHLTSPGPRTVSVERRRLSFADGRVTEWTFSSLRSVLLFKVHRKDGREYDYSERLDSKVIPVPFIQRGLGTRFALSNAAVDAIRARMLEDGWKERVETEGGGVYLGNRFNLTRK